jgi:2-polyprenyl-6-methoxyphenol hydroxylase-like FAD-dependent oxidoreductase
MSERVVVVGAGIAGLCAGLALAPSGREVVILERDEAAPAGDADAAFEDWNRRGVGHLRHSHAFLARLGLLLKAEHPGLLEELAAAGCREIGFEASLTPLHKARYRPRAEDADFRILISRRTTLELVIRRYVERLANVTLHSGVLATGLQLAKGDDGPIRVTGVETQDGRVFEADVVVEAGGKNAQLIEGLIERGAPIAEESESCGILYFTRHWRLNPGQSEPPRGELRTTGDLGFLKFGVFPADNGCFSITLCTPEIEMEMRQAIVRPETFDAICNLIPGTAQWIDPARASPISRVFGMGNLEGRWRDMVTAEGRPAVLGLYPLGDSLIRTNPLYGRGCSFAAVGAWLLREALEASPEPAARLAAYHERLHRELRPYFLSMRDQDRSAIRRAHQALTPSYRPSLKSRVLKSFFEDGVNIAIRSDPDLLREALRGFHMLEHPSAWLKRPGNLAKVLGHWARGRRAKAAAYPAVAGPEREAMMRALGLDLEADIQRLAA